MEVLLEKTKDAGVPGVPGSSTALLAVAAIWVTYFVGALPQLLRLRRAMRPTNAALRKGNIWGLPVNLILFSLVAGVTTIAAFDVYGEVLLHPDQISAKFDSWFLALLAALTFAVATLGINVVANFVSPAFDFANVFPKQIDFKRGGYIAALIALALYPFAPWEGGAAHFRQHHRRHHGPDLRRDDGRLLPDPQRLGSTSRTLYREDGEFRFQSGWHVNAFIAAGVGVAVLVDPAQLHQLAAVLVGRLWLVLRRGDRRCRLLRAALGSAGQRPEGGAGVGIRISALCRGHSAAAHPSRKFVRPIRIARSRFAAEVRKRNDAAAAEIGADDQQAPAPRNRSEGAARGSANGCHRRAQAPHPTDMARR